MSLRPIIEKINKLNNEIPKLRDQLKNSDEKLKGSNFVIVMTH